MDKPSCGLPNHLPHPIVRRPTSGYEALTQRGGIKKRVFSQEPNEESAPIKNSVYVPSAQQAFKGMDMYPTSQRKEKSGIVTHTHTQMGEKESAPLEQDAPSFSEP